VCVERKHWLAVISKSSIESMCLLRRVNTAYACVVLSMYCRMPGLIQVWRFDDSGSSRCEAFVRKGAEQVCFKPPIKNTRSDSFACDYFQSQK
jgi:hypothetical protein